MSRRSHRSPVWVLAAAAVLAVAAALFLYRDYRTAVRGHRQVLIQRGEALLDSLAAGMRAQGRMARARGDRMLLLFEEAAQIPGVLGVRLGTEDGRTVAEFGESEGLESAVPELPRWEESRLLQAARVELSPIVPSPGAPGQRMGGGRRLEAESSMPPGPYVAALALDARPVHRSARREAWRLAVSSGATAGVILLAAGLLWLWFRRVSLEADLARARELAAENQRLAHLGAGLAHETKNPLNLVRGLAQDILASASLTPEAHKNATRIVDEVDRTVGQINAFLEVSRPKEPRLEPVDLRPLLEEAASLVHSEAAGKEVAIEVDPEEVRALADSDQLRRAVLNLLINALRACDAGCRVRMGAERKGRLVSLYVSDDGYGIASEDLARVKEPYFSRFEGGTGLGLAITDRIARAHGASLTVESEPGRGTRVTLSGLRTVD